MQIIPAIDFIDGKCVRLVQGDFAQMTVYNEDPLKQAQIFKDAGVSRIHLVDLDGARGNAEGSRKNREMICKIKKEIGLEIETGGGIRSEDDMKELISNGIDYLILGTILIEEYPMIEKLFSTYGKHFIAGIDVRNNVVKTRGWKEGEGVNPIELGSRLYQLGFKTAVYTDISVDGKLTGPNIEATKKFSNSTKLRAILSGGVSCLEDIINAKAAAAEEFEGVIVGKAYYEGRIDLKKAVAELSK
ncbi:MAG: 1-(5-phosphoribosyl)-5-[Spirochaetales bacterium]|jgi:phosphoribosylformimino-5-aminoimidazole carboxamide ribotide isomerase|nr:1-(5-phosphoribosyl)-5-[(5-phosphoribosylamino)methylideneamino]imidazole-4-carboxamide isomerase [Spirochaetales bacterium]MBQ2294226.1 1-(5-phosphoribosyl)-5-[(5-phosphoribosylamino)methylideneamino]imidazole-4-carboxamide isomerase [Spirochaetales bacterium]